MLGPAFALKIDRIILTLLLLKYLSFYSANNVPGEFQSVSPICKNLALNVIRCLWTLQFIYGRL